MMRFPLRGGNWNNGTNAGLGALNLNNSRANSNSNIGFRPALDDNTARSTCLKGQCQSYFQKDAAASAIAEKQIRPLDASSGCLYKKLVQFDGLLEAAYQCKKGKTKSASTLRFFDNLEENIISLQNDLIWGSYTPSGYRHFFVFEPKRRLISAPSFRDRVLHRAVHNLIEPLFDSRFEYDSYACRKGKGAHAGADRAQLFIRQVERRYGKAYALKADISRYFSSIDHLILKGLLQEKIGCGCMLKLLFLIIDTSPTDTPGVGIPLGNLTSQLFANIYLHELDRYAKHALQAKRYIRYMDDFVLIHHDKAVLHAWRLQIEDFLRDELRLRTNQKTQVFPIGVDKGRSLDFLGYRVYASHRLLRKSSVKRIKTKLKKYRRKYASGDMTLSDINPKIQSWLGHASHANSYNLKKKLFSEPFKRSKT